MGIASSIVHSSKKCPDGKGMFYPTEDSQMGRKSGLVICGSSLQHSAGPLAFRLQAQSRGCVKVVG